MKPFPFATIDIKHAINNLPPTLNFILPKLGFLAGTVGAINAPGASGKSWLGLQLGAYLACNYDTLGLGSNEENKRVLILAAEDPEEILSKRLYTLAEKISKSQQISLIQNLTIASCLGKTGDLMDEGKTLSEIQLIASDFDLLIVDTLSRWHSGEENDRKDAAKIMRVLEKITKSGPAVLFLHHIGKGVQVSHQHAGRGSAVWSDEARWVAYLENVSSEDSKKFGIKDADGKKIVRLGVSKVNYSQIPESILLERQSNGMLVALNSEVLKQKNIPSPFKKHVEVSDEGDF